MKKHARTLDTTRLYNSAYTRYVAKTAAYWTKQAKAEGMTDYDASVIIDESDLIKANEVAARHVAAVLASRSLRIWALGTPMFAGLERSY